MIAFLVAEVLDCNVVFGIGLLLDYEYSMWGLPEGSSERLKAKHEVHLRSARKLQELCFKNGGIYIKLGQHIGQLVMLSICYVYRRSI